MNVRSLVMLAAVSAAGVARLAAQELNAVWGFGPAEIWAVGDRPVALRFDGTTWNEVPYGVMLSGSLNGLWGSGPRDLFAVGAGGMILHWDGNAWTRMAAPTAVDLVAVAGRSPTEVYAVAQSYDERQPPTLLRYDGRSWTAQPLPLPFRAAAVAVQGADVIVAGYAYFDPQPTQRRQAGVVARWSGGRWSVAGWDGQRVVDPAAGGVGWTRMTAGGQTILLYGQREDGTTAMAASAGGGWTLLPPAASAMSDVQVPFAFAGGDGTPVALFNGTGFARFVGGRWTPVIPPAAAMQQQMMQQAMQGGQMTQQQQQQMQRQQQLLAQMMANPMLMAMKQAAFDFGETHGVWAPSANDFYLATGNGRIIHVTGDDAQIVFDASCADPMMAGMNPICQALRMPQR